jgi:hypothetical protein
MARKSVRELTAALGFNLSNGLRYHLTPSGRPEQNTASLFAWELHDINIAYAHCDRKECNRGLLENSKDLNQRVSGLLNNCGPTLWPDPQAGKSYPPWMLEPSPNGLYPKRLCFSSPDDKEL